MDARRIPDGRSMDDLPNRARIFFKQIYGFSKGLDEWGVSVEKAVPRSDDGRFDFGNAMPKIIHHAETSGHLTLQHTYDFKRKVFAEPHGENIED